MAHRLTQAKMPAEIPTMAIRMTAITMVLVVDEAGEGELEDLGGGGGDGTPAMPGRWERKKAANKAMGT